MIIDTGLPAFRSVRILNPYRTRTHWFMMIINGWPPCFGKCQDFRSMIHYVISHWAISRSILDEDFRPSREPYPFASVLSVLRVEQTTGIITGSRWKVSGSPGGISVFETRIQGGRSPTFPFRFLEKCHWQAFFLEALHFYRRSGLKVFRYPFPNEISQFLTPFYSKPVPSIPNLFRLGGAIAPPPVP